MKPLAALLAALLAGCTTTHFRHQCASGEVVEVTAEGGLYTRNVGGLEIKDGCGGASIDQVKTDAVQAFEAGVKAAAGLIGTAAKP